MVGPIGIHHPDLRNGGVPFFLVLKIGLQELQIIQVHGKAQSVQQTGKSLLVQRDKPFHRGHMVGGIVVLRQRRGLIQIGLSGLHRVHQKLLDLLQLCSGQVPGQKIDFCRSHHRPLSAADELHTLGRRIRPLVKLSGQRLHGENGMRPLGDLLINVIHRRLAEHDGNTTAEKSLIQPLRIIAVQNTKSCQFGQVQKAPHLLQQRFGFHSIGRFLLGIDSVDHVSPPQFPAANALAPISFLL